MDPLANPYSMGAGNPPPALTGRGEQLDHFRLLLGRLAAGRHEPSMIVWGLRGVGKTVLLLELQRLAESELDWIAPPPVEIKSDTDFRAEIAELTFQALRTLSRTRSVGDQLKRFTGLLRGFKMAADGDGHVTFSFDADAVQSTAGTGDLERDLTTLLTEVGKAAREHQTGIVYLVDEMQFLAKSEMEALAAAMHRVGQLNLPVALVGAGLPMLPGMIVDAKSYAERLFRYPRLDRLDDDAAREALVRPAAQQQVQYAIGDSDPLDELLNLSGRYPAFIQAYGKGTWDAAESSPITLDDVRRAAPHVRERLDSEFFHTRFEKATPAEQRYMAGLADLGDEPQSSAAVATRLASTQSRLSVVRDQLIKKGLIYSPVRGQVEFTVPSFADYMRRRYPLD